MPTALDAASPLAAKRQRLHNPHDLHVLSNASTPNSAIDSYTRPNTCVWGHGSNGTFLSGDAGLTAQQLECNGVYAADSQSERTQSVTPDAMRLLSPDSESRGSKSATPNVRSRVLNESDAHGNSLHAHHLAPARSRLERMRWRKAMDAVSCTDAFELPGRPQVCYQMRDYKQYGAKGAEHARKDVPFLFKAFETGQVPPSRMRKMHGEAPRQATIHEYLDWTVTALDPEEETDVDFSGFKLLVLLQRFRPSWPAPGTYDTEPQQGSQAKHCGAPKLPLPEVLPTGRPLCVATIRAGPDYLEIPFFATSENHRGKGYGRCLLEAIEQVARACRLPRLMLCSTDDEDVRNTWSHLGFEFTTPQQLQQWDIREGDLLHMTNTVQMHKDVPPPPSWFSVRLRHAHYVQRLYVPAGSLPDSLKRKMRA